MQFEQAGANGLGMGFEFAARKRQHVADADGDQRSVDRLARAVLLQQFEEREPALLVGLRIRILRRVSPGRIDQQGVLGKPPVAIAGATDTCDCGRGRTAGKRKLQA